METVNTTTARKENMSENIDSNTLRSKSVHDLATPRKASVAASKPTAAKKLSSTCMTPHSLSKAQTRESATKTRLDYATEKIRQVSELKEKWAKEKERKLSVFKENRAKEMATLHAANEAAAETRRRETDAKLKFLQAQKVAEQDLLNSSVKDRTATATLKEKTEKERRRKSILLNEEILRKSKEREEEINRQARETEVSLLEARRLDFLQVREQKKIDETKRRESLMQRNEYFSNQRTVSESLSQQAKEEDKSLLEFRYEMWKDREEAKIQRSKRDRESIAFRLDTWRQQRSAEEESSIVASVQQQSEMESRRQDWIALQEYKKSVEESRRQSMAFRLDEWRNQRAAAEHEDVVDFEQRELERELKIQEAKDAQMYEEIAKRNKRESLAYRLDKARKDKSYEEGLQAVQAALEAEERRLAQQDREDVQNYRAEIVAARRQSMEYRNQTHAQESLQLQGEREIARAKEAVDRQIKEEEWRQVKLIRQDQREKDRRSLAMRLVQAKAAEEKELECHRSGLEAMHAELETRRLDWLSIRQSKVEEEERRRKSISYRLESWRQQKVAEEMLEAKKRYVAEEEAMEREMERENLAAAKLELREAVVAERKQANMVF